MLKIEVKEFMEHCFEQDRYAHWEVTGIDLDGHKTVDIVYEYLYIDVTVSDKTRKNSIKLRNFGGCDHMTDVVLKAIDIIDHIEMEES